MRQYPALVNCTTIDWFSEWPSDALLEVADKYLENTEMANEEEVFCILSPYNCSGLIKHVINLARSFDTA